MYVLYFLFAILTSFAETPNTDEPYEIIIEAHRNFEVFVAPPEITNNDPTIEAHVGSISFLQYSSSHWRNAKIRNTFGIYEPIGMHIERIYFYDEDTIKHVWSNCNYRTKPLYCGSQNNHYTIVPHIEIDSNQIVIRIFLYDEKMQIINSSTHTDDKIVHWIRQQELTVIQQQGMMGTTTVINKPKEELPLKWVIPQMLLDKHIHQASLKLWSGMKF